MALVLKEVGQSLGLNIFLAISLSHSEHFLDMKFATLVCNYAGDTDAKNDGPCRILKFEFCDF